MMTNLWIFEGPDGGGKTTFARKAAKNLNAGYVHHGPYPDIGPDNLSSVYFRSMWSTWSQTVVFDRSWLSEAPYGLAFRNGANRISRSDQNMLEWLAAQANARVVLCLPPFEVVEANFKKRTEREYLSTPDELRIVYNWYDRDMKTTLPVTHFDYTKDDFK